MKFNIIATTLTDIKVYTLEKDWFDYNKNKILRLNEMWQRAVNQNAK